MAFGMVACANLLGTSVGLIGSLIQARFISPDELGFLRKFSVFSSYAAFLSLGLFTILQRDYPLLVGQGEIGRARRVAAIVQSWCLLVSAVVGAALLGITLVECFKGHDKLAAAWFIQFVAVWSAVYGSALIAMYRSGQEFESQAKGQVIGALIGAAVLPLFWFWPFSALVMRSVASQAVLSVYLHAFRPLKVGWCLPFREFLDLVKRGMRLYVSDYLRYMFWQTIEIWLMLWFAGNAGVGLLVFSKVIIDATSQVSSAINQVYLPRIAQRFGETASARSGIQLATKTIR